MSTSSSHGALTLDEAAQDGAVTTFDSSWSGAFNSLADGKELYLLNGSNRLIAAEIGPGPAFSVTKLERLFDATSFGYVGYQWAFDATRDGKFVYLGPAGSAKPAAAQLVEVDNWFADIRARLQP